MRILVINDHERLSPRVECEVESLSNRYDVTVLSWDRSGDAEQTSRRDYVTVPAPTGSLLLAFYLPLLYYRMYRRIRSHDADVVHVTHFMFIPLGAAIGALSDVSIVYDAYERHAIEISYYLPFSRVVRWILQRFENICCRATDLILTVDTHDDFLAERYRAVHENVEVLYNVPTVATPNIDDELNARFEGKEVLAYVGHINEAKGALAMINSFEIVARQRPDAYLLLIGSFQDSQEAVESHIDEGGLENRIEHVEWLPYDRMMEYLVVADVGLALHQPRSEYQYVSTGTGRKFFTYMQAGLPIVGPEFWEIGEVVRETGCGLLVDTTDPAEIADAVDRLLSDGKYRAELCRLGRTAIEERYNWERESEKLLDRYERLAIGV